MSLTTAGDLLASGPAFAFNVCGLEHAEGILAGAERAGRGVILQISENCVRHHRGLAPIGAAVLAAAGAAAVPAAVHLDHATTSALVEEAVALGFGSVMFDAADRPYDENVAQTRAVVDACHARGVWVEGELGAIGGKDGVHDATARTDPAEAAEFVRATGVDALAVAVGSIHQRVVRQTPLDFDLIGRLRDAVPVPLVLHGGSGVSDVGLRAAVAHGIAKVNVATQLNKVFTAAVRRHLELDAHGVDPRRYLGAGRTAVADEVARLLAAAVPVRRS